jgi:hypothetical protein
MEMRSHSRLWQGVTMDARGTQWMLLPLIASNGYGVHRASGGTIQRLSQPSQECARAPPPSAIPTTQKPLLGSSPPRAMDFRPGNDAGLAGEPR